MLILDSLRCFFWEIHIQTIMPYKKSEAKQSRFDCLKHRSGESVALPLCACVAAKECEARRAFTTIAAVQSKRRDFEKEKRTCYISVTCAFET
jgi:hypothetical protein